jgi:hypothetical protein
MIRWIVAALLMAGGLGAQEGFESHAYYKVGYGFFTLGEAHALLKVTPGGRYETVVNVQTTGLAKVLSGNRRERYESHGRVVDGLLVPDRYQSTVRYRDRKRLKAYTFDHNKEEVYERQERCKDGRCKESRALFEIYAPDDLLTLYHNVGARFDNQAATRLALPAIGADEPVVIERPEGKQLKEAKETFERPGLYLVVTINQKIFTSDKGELFLNIDADRVATRAALKRTLLFGDVWGELEHKEIKGEWQ